MEQGWIKLHRNLLEHKSFWLNKDKLAIWLYLQLKATHNEATGYFEGKEITLKAGQLLASYQEIADFLDIDKGKVKRAIQSLRDDTRIDTRTDRQKSLITLIGWDNLQGTLDTRNDTAFDTRMTHDRHTFKETENEKEKRSKREKDKEKEINKNEKNERIYLYSGQPTEVSCQQGESDFLSSFNETDFLSKYDKVTAPTKNEELEQLFSEFWQAYPKKVGKGYALECFKRIKPSRKLLDTMLEAISKQKKSDMWKRDKGQYIPNPSTWLNQKRWEDDLGGETEEKPRLRLGTYL